MSSHSARRKLSALLAIVLLSALLPVVSRAATYTGTLNADKVFLRSRANTSSMYYDTLNKGEKVTITDTSGDFYKVSYKSFTGFVMKKFLDVSSAARKKLETPAYVSKYAKVKYISGLGDAPRETRSGSSGEDVEKLQRALQIKKHLNGNVDGKFGPTTEAAVRSYQRANKLSVTGRADSKTIQSLFGKLSETTAKTDPRMAGISKIGDIKVPNTSRPGNANSHVKALQQALKIKGYYKAPVDSSYGKQTTEAVTRYQKAVGLEADGIAGFSTIRKLFGKNAANFTYETEKLDWFANGSSTIPKGATFTIKDIATGSTFTARRWSGANHVDAEPANAASAKTMKEISGGSYSWARRAVLVRYNGHVYAGSINTMPHGTSTVSGNNYNGHFCLHFYKSKTHETNRVDGTHQNAVSRAMNASW
ncbi:MAG: peptidoglycan-binding protein [Eubacteriales bacterium]|nr:peptidoglycan-binding protein [Eubacteriales bacterium]